MEISVFYFEAFPQSVQHPPVWYPVCEVSPGDRQGGEAAPLQPGSVADQPVVSAPLELFLTFSIEIFLVMPCPHLDVEGRQVEGHGVGHGEQSLCQVLRQAATAQHQLPELSQFLMKYFSIKHFLPNII